MARYRKVEVRTWNDDRFRSLSPIPPCAQGLWLWLLTGPRTTNIPGIVVGTDAVMAAELQWSLEAFRKAFSEIANEGMAKACWKAGLVWLPNATRPGESRNKPESPNVIRSWRDTWDEIPECELKLEVWQQLKAFAESFGKSFPQAFREACRKPRLKASPIQEQEQEQKQEQEQNYSQNARARGEHSRTLASPREPSRAATVEFESAGGSEGKTAALTAPEPDLDPENREAWELVKATYPPHIHGEHHWLAAERDARQRVRDGERWSVIIAGCERFRRQQEALGNIGTKFVPAPTGFFSEREKRYLEPFPLPATKADQRLVSNIGAAAEAKRRLFGGQS